MTAPSSGDESPAPEAARWARLMGVLAGALEEAPSRRTAYLAAACGTDTALREEVEELLRASETSGFFDALVSADAPGPEPSGGSPRVQAPGARIGPYATEGILGRGGMGVVYAARRAEGGFEQEVALKVLPTDLVSGRVEERLRAERQILARLSHPNVARLLDGGVDAEGRPWFAMERVRGEAVLEYCDGRRLDVPARLDLFGAVCDGVQHAHENLVVHRDLKPNNILVGEDGVPKLLDFGIAKLLDADATGPEAFQTRVGLKVYTPAYASPEQRRGESVTTATDVYQLGILLYELLTGVHPFPHRTRGDAERSSGGVHGEPGSGAALDGIDGRRPRTHPVQHPDRAPAAAEGGPGCHRAQGPPRGPGRALPHRHGAHGRPGSIPCAPTRPGPDPELGLPVRSVPEEERPGGGCLGSGTGRRCSLLRRDRPGGTAHRGGAGPGPGRERLRPGALRGGDPPCGRRGGHRP